MNLTLEKAVEILDAFVENEGVDIDGQAWAVVKNRIQASEYKCTQRQHLLLKAAGLKNCDLCREEL